MTENIRRSASQISVPLGQVASEEILEKFLGKSLKVGGIADFALWG
jgi:hypothetical protein